MKSFEYLKLFYDRKKKRSPHLSVRSLAKSLDISPSYVSSIFNGKKPIPSNKLPEILQALEIDEFASLYLKNCMKNEGIPLGAMEDNDFLELYFQFDAEEFDVFKEWFYVPLMELTTLKTFIEDNFWIAEKLGISEAQVGVAIYQLKRAGFLVSEDGQLKKTKKRLIYKTQRPEKVAQKYHKNMIGKTLQQFEKNDQSEYERRAIVGYTLAVNPDVLQDVVKKLKEDLLTSASIATNGNCRDVYQLNLQFFPLTSNK